MRAFINRLLVAIILATFAWVPSAVAQSTSMMPGAPPAALTDSNIVDAICGKHFPRGATYVGTEIHTGRFVGITNVFTECIDIGRTHNTVKLTLMFERHESGAAPKKREWLEYIVLDATNLKWRNMLGAPGVQHRYLVLAADGRSYVEKLDWGAGKREDVRYRRTK